MRIVLILMTALCSSTAHLAGQKITTLDCPPTLPCTFFVVEDSFPAGAYGIEIDPGVNDGTVPFQYTGVTQDLLPGQTLEPNYVVVSPSRGIAPAVYVGIGLNSSIVPFLPVGHYDLRVNFAPQAAPTATISAFVTLFVTLPPPPSVTAVLNAATLQPGISPGALVTIQGSHLSTPPITGQYNDAGLYPTALGNTQVLFDGIAAPLLYVSQNQINAIVPFGAGTGAPKKTCITVNRLDVSGIPLSLSNAPGPYCIPLADTSPGVFTVSQTGSGQGAILNANTIAGGLNSASNPANQGSTITFYATGGGVLNQPIFAGVQQPPVQDGRMIYFPIQPNGQAIAPAAPVSVTIGGQPAKIGYAGAAPDMVAGTIQINAQIPSGIGSGAQPLVLKIGSNDNSQQNVTVAVQ